MKFQRFSFSLLFQLKSGTKRDTQIVFGCPVNLFDSNEGFVKIIMQD